MLRELLRILSWVPLTTYLVFKIDLPLLDVFVVLILAAVVAATHLVAAASEDER